MAAEQAPEKGPPVVRYNGVEYRIITEMTERERFDAERISGRSLNEVPGYTAVLLMAFFTLKRQGIAITFDEFLDGGGFVIAEETPPPTQASENDEKQPSDVVHIAAAGSQR